MFVGSGFIVVRSGPLGPVSLLFFAFLCFVVFLGFLCQSTNDGAKVQIYAGSNVTTQVKKNGAKVQMTVLKYKYAGSTTQVKKNGAKVQMTVLKYKTMTWMEFEK